MFSNRTLWCAYHSSSYLSLLELSAISTLSNEEDAALEQSRGIVNEDNDNYEIPVATAISDSKVVLVLPHAEPNDLAEDIVVVDAKVTIHVFNLNE